MKRWTWTALLLLPGTGLAGPIILEVSDEITLGLDGMWGRVFPADDGLGWEVFWGKGGDYAHVTLAENLSFKVEDIKDLTGHNDLIDHAITRCPDGTYLHIASANIDTHDDSAYAFRYSTDYTLTAAQLFEDRNPSLQHNDMSVVCSDIIEAAGFMPKQGTAGTTLFELDRSNLVVDSFSLEGAPNAGGSAMLGETDPHLLTTVGFGGPEGVFMVTQHDPDLDLVETHFPYLVPEDVRGFWTQGIIRAGDVYLVAHMVEDSPDNMNTNEGNVWLQVYDLDWNHLEGMPISTMTEGPWGMRPSLARQGDQVLVLFDREFHLWGHLVTVDLKEMGVTENGAPDPGDSGTPPPDDESAGCGGESAPTGEETDGDEGSGGCDSAVARTHAPVATLAIWLFALFCSRIRRSRGNRSSLRPGEGRPSTGRSPAAMFSSPGRPRRR